MDHKKFCFPIKNEFVKNVFTLLSGASVAQIITLAAIPVLTRLFTPEQFGYIALFVSLTNIIATFATGRYELAIMLPKSNLKAFHIMTGSLLILSFFTIVTLLGIYFAKNYLNFINHYISPDFFYFLPLSVFVVGCITCFTQWMNRHKEFPYLAKTKIGQSSASSGVNLSMGFFTSMGATGLFMGYLSGQIAMFLSLAIKITRQSKKNIQSFDKIIMRQEMNSNRNFPLYSAPMGLLNVLSSDILIYVFSIFYSTTLVGLYANANKVINYPLSLISQSFTSVFYQKINETKKKRKLYTVSYLSNLLIGFVAVTPIIFWGEDIFKFVLGDEWEFAGKIAKFMAPLTVASFAMRCVSNVFSLTRKNQLLLIWQILYLIVVVVVIFASKNGGFEKMLFSFSVTGAILYSALAMIGYEILKDDPEKI